MKIEEGSTNKMNRIDKQFSISIILALMIFSQSATNLFAATRPTVAVQLPVYKSEIFQERSGS
jgi:hypothetical protein